MRLIEEYMLLDQTERQDHLDLSEPCIIRGSNSIQCRGLLAHVLDTTIPKGLKVVCAHACHNGECSNPKHLYWATASENLNDAFASGAREKKPHSEETKRLIGRNTAKSLIGVPKSVQHRKNISEALKQK